MENLIKELELKIERLEYENKLKNGLISILSHDAKGISGNILWLIEAVEQKTISHEDFFNLLPQIKRDAQKNLQTIQDTTEWLKTQYGKFQIQKKTIKVLELYQGMKDEYENTLHKKEINFHFEGDPEQAIKTDPLLIKTILSKLLSNAIKYSSHGQDIYLQSSVDKNEVILSIIDVGIGISEGNLKTLFSFDNPIFKGTDGEIGAGLSLKIVHGFVYLINGRIEVQSSANKGTSVHIFLPKS